jgi:hypothetical protein
VADASSACQAERGFGRPSDEEDFHEEVDRARRGCVRTGARRGLGAGGRSSEQRIAALERQVATLTQALAVSPAAPAQTPADRKIAALTKRVTALEKRVKKAETTLNQTTLTAAAAIVYSGCLAAVTADALNGTWNVVDQLATATQAGKVYFGPQAPVNDFNFCQQAFRITRQTSVPPSVANFSALTALLGSRYALLSARF